MMVKENMVPDYELIHDGGGRHVNTFTYRVSCDGLSATGTGRCKKDAKHEAAKAMLETIAAHRHFPQLPAASTPDESPSMSPFHSPLSPKMAKVGNLPFVNAVGELQELCLEHNLKEPKYVLIKDVGPPHARVFTIRCKMSNFEEDGIATTKKQAKHYAAKKMMDRMKDLVINSNDFRKERNEDHSSDLSDTSALDKERGEKAEERYRELYKAKKIYFGIKLSEYHIHWKNMLETDKCNELLQQLAYTFPSDFFDNKYITYEEIETKVSELETVLSEFDVTIDIKDIATDDHFIMKTISLTTCPVMVQFGRGRTNEEATWKALCNTITSLKLFLE
ncbi:hypothetical protein PUN28_002684 [Cardiocondyla obscurior]